MCVAEGKEGGGVRGQEGQMPGISGSLAPAMYVWLTGRRWVEVHGMEGVEGC
jgi:hypothetical protein